MFYCPFCHQLPEGGDRQLTFGRFARCGCGGLSLRLDEAYGPGGKQWFAVRIYHPLAKELELRVVSRQGGRTTTRLLRDLDRLPISARKHALQDMVREIQVTEVLGS